MPQAGTVKITGLRQVMAGLNRIEKGAHKAVFAELLQSAEPVRRSWAGKLQRYRGASTSTLTPAMTTKSVFVRQQKRKVSGKRGDFGSIQMRKGLEALFEEADNTTREVERAMDRLTMSSGF